MKGYKSNIEEQTIENLNFRKVLFTGEKMQLVVMSLKPQEEIGMEVHEKSDQFFRFEEGEGMVIIDGEE
ncbi:MAG TPA: cupin domain-containing protein, partial [Patescibacteria group bacterium]